MLKPKIQEVCQQKKKSPTTVINVTEAIIPADTLDSTEELEDDEFETYVDNDPEQPIFMGNNGTNVANGINFDNNNNPVRSNVHVINNLAPNNNDCKPDDCKQMLHTQQIKTSQVTK
jgi:hypothetical protein